MNLSQDQKPGLITAIAIVTLTSGIINLFWGFVASATALGTIIGVVCLPLTILPTILGVFEIIYAAKLLSSQPQPVQPSQPIAIFQILTFLYGNIFSMIAGILNLIFFNDLTVKAYFAQLNGSQIYPSAPVMPVALEAPAPSPIPNELVLPQPPEQPEKPKPPRKIS